MSSNLAERGRSQAYERLRRLLFLVPFISKHPGLAVDEVAKAVGVTKKELLEELDLLTLVGRPPFQPDDFIDVYVEDDRVFLECKVTASSPPCEGEQQQSSFVDATETDHFDLSAHERRTRRNRRRNRTQRNLR